MPMCGVSHLHDALYHSAASLLPEQVQQPNLESRGPKDLQVLLWGETAEGGWEGSTQPWQWPRARWLTPAERTLL